MLFTLHQFYLFTFFYINRRKSTLSHDFYVKVIISLHLIKFGWISVKFNFFKSIQMNFFYVIIISSILKCKFAILFRSDWKTHIDIFIILQMQNVNLLFNRFNCEHILSTHQQIITYFLTTQRTSVVFLRIYIGKYYVISKIVSIVNRQSLFI